MYCKAGHLHHGTKKISIKFSSRYQEVLLNVARFDYNILEQVNHVFSRGCLIMSAKAEQKKVCL